METQTTQLVDEWVNSMETVERECEECAQPVALRVTDYIQSESSYGFPFDAIFYGGKCSACGYISEWGQREVESADATLLRERWSLLIYALNTNRAIAAQSKSMAAN